MNRLRNTRFRIAMVLAAAAAAQGASAADAPVQFPAGLAGADLAGWLQRNTDLEPASVIAVTPSAVTGVLSSISTPQGPTIRQVNLRSEAISRADFERDHILSWTSVIEVDCQRRKARLGRTMAYTQRNLLGEGRETVAASPAWVAPLAGGPAYNVMLKVCDGKTINPLTGVGTRLAVAPKAPATSSPVAPAAKPAPPQVKAAPAPAARPIAVQQHAEPPPKPAAAKPKPAAALAARPTPPRPVKPGPASAQVAAADSEADARRALAAAQARSAPPAGVTGRVEKAVVGGKTYFRAKFAGFATPADAQAYCRAAGAKGCLVRAR